ncbi:MAG: hypothetical protein WAM39_30930 [Bryobacteraceae bacterium]
MPSGFTLVDVAIGLIIVYVVLSLLCSSVNEGIETFVKNRSRQLERGIRELFNDPDGTEITHLLYNHPLISGLFHGEYNPKHLKLGRILEGKFYRKRNLPSYIPSANFALALLDIVLPASGTQLSGAAATLGSGANPARTDLVEALRQAAVNFHVPAVGKGLTVLIDASANDLEKVRTAIESWFNASMDRVGGWYKRRTQIILFVIAIAAASTLNIDTVHIVDRLLADPSVRSSLVATAQEYARTGVSPSPVGSNPQTGEVPIAQRVARVEDNLSRLRNLGVPIGWSEKENLKGKYYWFLKVAGILASALAATLGAPFWFDILSRFVDIRSTIKPRDKG